MADALRQLPGGYVEPAGAREGRGGDVEGDGSRSAEKREGVNECYGKLAGRCPHPDSSSHHLPVWQKYQAPIELVLLAGVRIVLLTIGHNGAVLAINSTHACASSLNSPASRSPAMPCNGHAVARLWEASKLCIRTWQCEAGHRGPLPQGHDVPLRYTLTHYPALPLRVPQSSKNVNGAGDCLLATTAAAACVGISIACAVAVGMEAARATVESGENVPYKILQDSVSKLLT